MSIEAYKAAWAAECKPADKIVLLAIAEFASAYNGYTCTAANGTLAEMVGVTEQSIRRTMRRLEAAGLVKTTVCHGRNLTNVYDISGLLTVDDHYKKPGVDDGFYTKETGRRRRVNGHQKPGVDAIKPIVDAAKTGRGRPPNRIKPNKPIDPPTPHTEKTGPPLKWGKQQFSQEFNGHLETIWPAVVEFQNHCTMPKQITNFFDDLWVMVGFDGFSAADVPRLARKVKQGKPDGRAWPSQVLEEWRQEQVNKVHRQNGAAVKRGALPHEMEITA